MRTGSGNAMSNAAGSGAHPKASTTSAAQGRYGAQTSGAAGTMMATRAGIYSAPSASAPSSSTAPTMAHRPTRAAASVRRPTPAANVARARAAGLASSAASSSTSSSQAVGQQVDDVAHGKETRNSREALSSMPTSLFAALPRPDFGEARLGWPTDGTAWSKQIINENRQKAMAARLLQHARVYAESTNKGDLGQQSDLISTSFYAFLTLCIDPSQSAARRLFAETRLYDARIFPFGPSTTSSQVHAGSFGSAAASQAGAQSAIEILKDGPGDFLRDTRSARILAAAYGVLDRLEDAQGLLHDNESNTCGIEADVDLPFALPSLKADRNGTSAAMQRGVLQTRRLRIDDARKELQLAMASDPFCWSAWTLLCDLGCSSSNAEAFGAQQHDAKAFYQRALGERMLASGLGKEVIQNTLAEIARCGTSYFAKPALEEKQEAIQTKPEEMQRTLSDSTTNILASSEQARVPKRPVAQTSAETVTFTRPGTKAESNAAAKRPRMAAEEASVRGTMRQGNTGRGIRSAAESLKQAVGPSSKVKASVEAVRQANLLSVARTNEPQRPPSSASSSDKSTTGGSDLTKSPARRSARSNPPPHVDIPDRQASATRKLSEAKAVSALQPATANPKLPDRHASPPTPLLDKLVKEATQKACEAADFWTDIDAAVADLVQVFAKSYNAVRNGRGRLAIALLRNEKAVSARDADAVKQEASLHRDSTVRLLGGLDDKFRNTAEIQSLLGRAFHGLGQYSKAERHFDHARYLSSSLVQHMDVYSLSLFHLQRDAQLSALASQLSMIDSQCCEGFIAAGNAFALQREHAHALRTFQRACLASPRYAYAYTLVGYEALELGDIQQSLQYFREALKIDPRHWNALAGLGQIYLHSDKREAAAYYYKRAVQLVPGNAVLWDIYGRVISSQGKLQEAQKAFEQSINLDETSAMSHVKLAEILLRRAKGRELRNEEETVERHAASRNEAKSASDLRSEAHEHLVAAGRLAPEEAHIHLLLAKSFMEMGEGVFAILHHSQRGAGAPSGEDGEVDAADSSKRPGEVSIADLAYMTAAGPAHLVAQQHQIRARGLATMPKAYQAEIAKHLCTAIDLNPRLGRYVKAMGEGARAALRGAASRMMGELGVGDGSAGASMLIDPSGMTTTDVGLMTGQGEESMLESGEMDEVLEDEGEYAEDSAAYDEEEEDVVQSGGEQYSGGVLDEEEGFGSAIQDGRQDPSSLHIEAGVEDRDYSMSF